MNSRAVAYDRRSLRNGFLATIGNNQLRAIVGIPSYRGAFCIQLARHRACIFTEEKQPRGTSVDKGFANALHGRRQYTWIISVEHRLILAPFVPTVC